MQFKLYKLLANLIILYINSHVDGSEISSMIAITISEGIFDYYIKKLALRNKNN